MTDAKPITASAWLERAWVYLREGREGLGLASVGWADKMDPDNTQGTGVAAAQLLARYWIRVAGKPMRGVHILEEAIERFPGDAEIGLRYWLARGWIVAGHPEKALAVLDVLIERDPSVGSREARASFLLRHGLAPERVREDLDAVLAAEPDSASGHFMMSRHLLSRGSLSLAEDHADRALKLAPGKALYRDTLDEIRGRRAAEAAEPRQSEE